MWTVFPLLFGCVSKGNYELLQVQLDATRTALTTTQGVHYQDVEAREAEIEVLQDAALVLETRIADLELRLQSTEEAERLAREELAVRLAQLEAYAPDPDEERLSDDELAAIEGRADRIAQALDHLEHVERDQASLDAHHAQTHMAFRGLEQEGRLEVRQDGDDMVVRIPTKQIFNEDLTSVSPRGELLLTRLVDALHRVPRADVLVMGHTDDRPYHGARHNSSWELGFHQAMTLLRTLQQADIRHDLSAGSSAGTVPLVTNDTADGRDQNRRLELVIGMTKGPWPEGSAAAPPQAPHR